MENCRSRIHFPYNDNMTYQISQLSNSSGYILNKYCFFLSEMFSRKRKQHSKRDGNASPLKKKRNNSFTDKKQTLSKSKNKNSKFSIKFSDKGQMGKHGKSKSDQKRGPRPSNLKKGKNKRKR